MAAIIYCLSFFDFPLPHFCYFFGPMASRKTHSTNSFQFDPISRGLNFVASITRHSCRNFNYISTLMHVLHVFYCGYSHLFVKHNSKIRFVAIANVRTRTHIHFSRTYSSIFKPEFFFSIKHSQHNHTYTYLLGFLALIFYPLTVIAKIYIRIGSICAVFVPCRVRVSRIKMTGYSNKFKNKTTTTTKKY